MNAMPGASEALHLEGVTKAFGGNVAVDEFTADFSRGVVYGLIGPNGSGKTTVVNLVSRFLDLDAGEIYLDGEAIGRRKAHEVASLGIVRTFQMPKSLGSMSVRENLLAVGAADHRTERLIDLKSEVDEVIALVGLGHLADGPASSLSGGQTMLLQLARATICRPAKVLMLDEPFAGVAPAIKSTMIATILRIKEEHDCVVVLVSHEMDTIRRVCDRVCVMNNGRLLIEGPIDEVMTHPQVVDAYLGRPV